jgi:hypothetical protein
MSLISLLPAALDNAWQFLLTGVRVCVQNPLLGLLVVSGLVLRLVESRA